MVTGTEQDDLNVPMIATVGAVSVILTVAIIYAVQALYFNFANSEAQRKVFLAPTADSDSRLAEQEAVLTRYSWVNRETNRVTIPIDRAMKLVIRDLQGGSAPGRSSSAQVERTP